MSVAVARHRRSRRRTAPGTGLAGYGLTGYGLMGSERATAETAAAHRACARVEAHEHALAPVVLRLRAAWDAAAAVPALATWRALAGRLLDHGWDARAEARDLACRLASRAIAAARTPGEVLVASQAYGASLALWRVARGGRR